MKNVNNNPHIRVKLHKMAFVLKSLEIENFKCFKKKQDISFEKITLLTGANSSGKSSILHAILGLIQSGEFPYKFSTNGKFVNMGDFEQVVYNHSENNIKLSLSFKETGNKVEDIFKLDTEWGKDNTTFLPILENLKFSCRGTDLYLKKSADKYLLDYKYNHKEDPEYTPEKAIEFKKNFYEKFHTDPIKHKFSSKKELQKQITRIKKLGSSIFKSVHIKSHPILNLETISEETESLCNLNLDFTIDGLIKNISSGYLRSINAISSFRHHPDRTYLEQSKDRLKIDKFGEGYLDQILLWERKNQSKFDELNLIMKDLGLLESISSNRIKGGRYEVQVATSNSKIKNSLFDVGFGISQFLPIIVADLQLGDNSTLFVAEPEIHLHPNVQAKFVDFLLDQINKKNKNYVLETHSEYLLNRLRLRVVMGKIKESDVAIYYLDNNGKDATIHKLLFNKKGQIIGAPKSFFDTYLMDIKDIALNVE
jgi:predicted ATPase